MRTSCSQRARGRFEASPFCYRGLRHSQLCAGLLTPHEGPTGGLLPFRRCSESKNADEARADGERRRPSVGHSGGVRETRAELQAPAPTTFDDA